MSMTFKYYRVADRKKNRAKGLDRAGFVIRTRSTLSR